MSGQASRRVPLGRIVGLFGVKGWVKVYSYTEPRENIFDYRDWQLRQGGKIEPVRVEDYAVHGKNLIARIDGCTDRDQAAAWIGAEIDVSRAQLPDLADGYYWCDLQDMRVETLDGVDLGRVDHLFSTGANDVMVVRGERERMLPWLRPDVIVEVDTRRGRIRVDWDPEF